MAKNPNIYKFEIIERIITEVDFTTKEEVVEFAKKVRDIADRINNGDTINLVFSEYGASNSTLDIKDTYFGQLILDTEK